VISSGTNLKTISISDNRRPVTDQLVKTFTLHFANFSTSSGRSFLTSLVEGSGCDQMPPYKFTYMGVNSDDTSNDPMSTNPNSIDFWGYYNGRNNISLFPALYVYPSLAVGERYRITPIPGYNGTTYTLNGADRTANSLMMTKGVLSAISYPAGGVATFNFGPHDFYDGVAAQNITGGGLRINSMTYFDGMNQSTLISKTFTYTEASTGHSSGRLISRPSFVIPTWKYKDYSSTPVIVFYGVPTGQDIWDYFTTRTETDISSQETSQGSPVIYKEVTVTRVGAGSAKFEYTLPGVFGETVNGSWTATKDKFARYTDCPTMSVVSAGGEWGYPSVFNPNYDHERGLLIAKTEYNSTGQQVRKTTNTYQYLYKSGNSPAMVYGLGYDKYANGDENIYFFGKYFLLTDLNKVLFQETVQTSDATNVTKSVTETTQHNYASAYHRLVTSVQKTASDGIVYTSKLTYPLDYQGIPASNIDKALTMVKNLQTAFRNGTPIEQVSTIIRPTQAEKVIGATLVKFNDFGLSKILADSVFSLSIASGITDFHPSAMAVFGGVTWLKPDSRYELATKFLSYDTYQRPLSQRGVDRTVSTVYWGYNKTTPVAQATNAAANQFTFSDFETTTGYEFTPSSTITGTGRTGATAMHPVVKLSRNLIKANVNNYIVSFWMKKLSAQVDINISINSSLVATVHANPASSNFEYFEQLIPMSSVTNGASFLVEIQGVFTPGFNPPSDPALLPMIDDVAFYPETAMVASSTFTFPFGPSSVTNARKVTGYMVYDRLGRTKYVLDRDQNIVKKNTYIYAAMPAPVFSAVFTVSSPRVNRSPVIFTPTNTCIDGVSYQWDYGDGHGFVAGSSMGTFTYSAAGTYTVQLKVTHPTLGALTTSQPVVISLYPITLDIWGKGIATYNTPAILYQPRQRGCIPLSVSLQWLLRTIPSQAITGSHRMMVFPAGLRSGLAQRPTPN